MYKFLDNVVQNKKSHSDKFYINQIVRCSTFLRVESDFVETADVLADVHCLRKLETNSKLKDDIKLIFYTKHFPHISAVSQEYYNQTGEPIHNLINKNFSNNRNVMLNIVNYSINPLQYYVETFRKFTKTTVGDPNVINCIILLRSEVDLVTIKNEFERTVGKSLRDAIRHSTSGFYKYALYELIGEMRSNKS